MKTRLQLLIALVLIIGALYWAVDSVRARSYTGGNLNFGIGHGPVTVTNPSGEPVSAQFISPGSRSFTVSSSVEGIEGASTRQGSGRDTSQLFEFVIPSGVSTYSVIRGTNVSFVAGADANLVATMEPTSADETRTTFIVTAIVVLGALFYMSRATQHQWIGRLRQVASAQSVKPLAGNVP